MDAELARINDSKVHMSGLGPGTIIWMLLRHPYHQEVYNRLYLVVDQALGPALGPWVLAVVGLETNGGLGESCYEEYYQRHVMNLKECEKNTSGQRWFDAEPDEKTLYVCDDEKY
ncbi:hypothetical protein H2200_013189 [Cladophialophora chaetospira]|uniref:Uncharacterized protein n=1 Tax=Cladophialophora chaetospira TaxID=386627 RepID=A0AA38WWB8_9EURO|nr:hypothetical protein H2200_013189 [Cladophialophora chaetospira]